MLELNECFSPTEMFPSAVSSPNLEELEPGSPAAGGALEPLNTSLSAATAADKRKADNEAGFTGMG